MDSIDQLDKHHTKGIYHRKLVSGTLGSKVVDVADKFAFIFGVVIEACLVIVEAAIER